MLLRPTANVCAGLDQRSRRADWIDRDQNDTIVHGCGIDLAEQTKNLIAKRAKKYICIYSGVSVYLKKMDWCGLEC